MIETETCPVCKRNVYTQHMTVHHWHPTSLGGTNETTMRICTTCHSVLHEVIPLKEVINYKTPESLQENWIFKQYLDFIWTKTHPHPYKVKKLLRSILSPFVIKNYIGRIKAMNQRKQAAVSSLR
jgi:RNA polymerase subunit RPABC4/transcription elongation factor Spt4